MIIPVPELLEMSSVTWALHYHCHQEGYNINLFPNMRGLSQLQRLFIGNCV